MKKIDKKNKILYSVIFLIIVIGAIIVAITGFNVEKNYKQNQKIEINLQNNFELDKMQEIADEVFGKNKATVQTVEIFNDSIQITSSEISEEQKNTVVEKINNLYKTENEDNIVDISEVETVSVGNVRLRDIYKPYIIPLSISTIAVLVYVAIRNWKSNSIKSLLEVIITIIISQLLLFSILAIIRFPMGSLSPVLMIFVYVMSIWCSTNKKK